MQSARGPSSCSPIRRLHSCLQKGGCSSVQGLRGQSPGIHLHTSIPEVTMQRVQPLLHSYPGGLNSKSGFGFPGFRVVQLSHIDSPAHVFNTSASTKVHTGARRLGLICTTCSFTYICLVQAGLFISHLYMHSQPHTHIQTHFHTYTQILHTYIHTHIFVYAYTQTLAHTFKHRYITKYTNTHTYSHACLHSHTVIQTLRYTYIHIALYTYVLKHTESSCMHE